MKSGQRNTGTQHYRRYFIQRQQTGHITNVTLKNVEWFHQGPIIISGFGPNNRVQNVTFENCTVAGNPLKTLEKKIFSINEFIDNITVQ